VLVRPFGPEELMERIRELLTVPDGYR